MGTQAPPARLYKSRLGPWKGMNEKASPESLPPGVAADIQNFFLDEQPGAATTRQGSINMTALPSGLSPRDAYVFSKTDGSSYLMVSDGVTLYYTTDPNVSANWTSLKTGLTSSAFMSWETAEDKVWMSNGSEGVMSWDGTTLLTYDRTYTNTTNAAAVSATTIQHVGLTGVDGYWIGMKLVFTVGANQGTVVTVTNYVSATNTLTYSPATSGQAVTDRWALGLNLPLFNALRYWDGHLWGAVTAAVRFSELSDPNTGASINLDNPQAWPSGNSINASASDGDKVWGISPILRDRILIHKKTGIWRIERDNLTKYRPELVSQAIGSRFQDSWVEKNYMLYFVGQDRDDLPEVYKTDMVSVVRVDPDGGVEPTITDLRQPNQVQRLSLFSSESAFDSGSESTGTDTSGGTLAIGGLGSLWSSYTTKSNASIGNSSDKVDITGIPFWTSRYDGSVQPESDSPVWTQNQDGGNLKTNPLGIATIESTSGNSTYDVKRSDVLTAGQHSMMVIRGRSPTNTLAFHFGLWNGAKAVYVYCSTTEIYVNGTRVSNAGDNSVMHTYTLLLDSAGNWKLWLDGVSVGTGTAGISAFNKISFGYQSNTSDPLTVDACWNHAGNTSRVLEVEYCYFHDNVIDSTIPDTLPTTGQIVMQADYTRAPDALRNVYSTFISRKYGALCGTTSASTTVQLDTGADMTKFSAGQVVDIVVKSTQVAISNGSSRTIQSVNSGAFTIAIDAGGGAVTTTSSDSVMIHGGSLAVESLTSTSSDFASGLDPAGYVSVAQGAAPTSLAYRYQRFRITLTRVDYANGPQLQNVQSGLLWTSPAIDIGANIASWRTFQTSVTTPAGTTLATKIRAATTTATPSESDWGSWTAISSGNNIGTILVDGTPPSTRWLQIKVESGPSSAGLLPIGSSFLTQWVEGSAATLPLRAVLHKKRYLFCAASSSATSNDTVIVNDRNDQWTKISGWNLNQMIHYKGNFIGLSSSTAYAINLDVSGLYTDNGTAITAYITDKVQDMGSPQLRKDFKYQYLHTETLPAALTFTAAYKRSGDTAFTSLSSASFGTAGVDVRLNFPFATTGRKIQMKYTSSDTGKYAAFLGSTLYYSVRPEQPN